MGAARLLPHDMAPQHNPTDMVTTNMRHRHAALTGASNLLEGTCFDILPHPFMPVCLGLH